jgi:hypothetical protein
MAQIQLQWKKPLSTTLPRIFDGELVYMRSTQTTVGGGAANATGRTFSKFFVLMFQIRLLNVNSLLL